MAEVGSGKLIDVVITIVIAVVLYGAVLAYFLTEAQDNTSTMYAGSGNVLLVGIISTFYWLAVALFAIGMVRKGKK